MSEINKLSEDVKKAALDNYILGFSFLLLISHNHHRAHLLLLKLINPLLLLSELQYWTTCTCTLLTFPFEGSAWSP